MSPSPSSRRKRECINAAGAKRLFCKATPVIAAYRVVSLPLHGLLAGLLASIPCQVTQEKRTENSMFGSGVSVIVLGVEAFPRQSLVHWQHTPFLTRKLVIAAVPTIDYQLFTKNTKNFQVQCYSFTSLSNVMK